MDQRYDAVVAVAMHSKAGTKGFLAHTATGTTIPRGYGRHGYR